MDFTRGDTIRWSTGAGFCDCEFVGRDGDEAGIITPGSGFRIVSMFDLKPLPQSTPSDTVPEKPKTCGECAAFGHSCHDLGCEATNIADQSCFATKTEWKPKAGDECMVNDSDVKQDLRLTWDRFAWICTAGHPEYPGRIVLLSSLRPLPPEPPVKVGDVLRVVTEGGSTYYGPVGRVEPKYRHFLLMYPDGTRGFDWDDVTVTHLVPSTLYDKMRKRLEELRDNANTSAPTQERLCKALLADLETYAREAAIYFDEADHANPERTEP